jgi:hypothetical protein
VGVISRFVSLMKMGLDRTGALRVAMLGGLVAVRLFLSDFSMTQTAMFFQALMARDKPLLYKTILLSFLRGIVQTGVDTFQKHTERQLQVQMLSGMTGVLQEKVLRNSAFYVLKNIDGRVDDMDTRISDGVSGFCETVSETWSQSAWPLVRILWFAGRFIRARRRPQVRRDDLGVPHLRRLRPQVHHAELSAPPRGWLSALSVFLCKSVLYGAFVWARRALNNQKRRFPARADKKIVADMSGLEGKYKFVHARVRTHAESIAFFGGGARETLVVQSRIYTVMASLRSKQRKDFFSPSGSSSTRSPTGSRITSGYPTPPITSRTRTSRCVII